jgi:hypothetical protein
LILDLFDRIQDTSQEVTILGSRVASQAFIYSGTKILRLQVDFVFLKLDYPPPSPVNWMISPVTASVATTTMLTIGFARQTIGLYFSNDLKFIPAFSWVDGRDDIGLDIGGIDPARLSSIIISCTISRQRRWDLTAASSSSSTAIPFTTWRPSHQ